MTERFLGLTDAEWNEGWDELKANLPDREMSLEQAARRGNSYRRELGHLTNEQWIHAVQAAIRSLSWFPVISELLEFSREVLPPNAGVLPAVHRPETPAEVEQWRAGIQAGLDGIRAEMARRGMPLDQVGKAIPAAPRARKRARRTA